MALTTRIHYGKLRAVDVKHVKHMNYQLFYFQQKKNGCKMKRIQLQMGKVQPPRGTTAT